MHCVHSDTLYVKNRRNKSEKKIKKKTPAAIVKNPRVLEYYLIFRNIEPNGREKQPMMQNSVSILLFSLFDFLK
jgi:hypothetical protein